MRVITPRMSRDDGDMVCDAELNIVVYPRWRLDDTIRCTVQLWKSEWYCLQLIDVIAVDIRIFEYSNVPKGGIWNLSREKKKKWCNSRVFILVEVALWARMTPDGIDAIDGYSIWGSGEEDTIAHCLSSLPSSRASQRYYKQWCHKDDKNDTSRVRTREGLFGMRRAWTI